MFIGLCYLTELCIYAIMRLKNLCGVWRAQCTHVSWLASWSYRVVSVVVGPLVFLEKCVLHRHLIDMGGIFC